MNILINGRVYTPVLRKNYLGSASDDVEGFASKIQRGPGEELDEDVAGRGFGAGGLRAAALGMM